jgi:hypothetical protein
LALWKLGSTGFGNLYHIPGHDGQDCVTVSGGLSIEIVLGHAYWDFSMLATVIYDLSTPLSGAFQVRTVEQRKEEDNHERLCISHFLLTGILQDS